jgi:hypothetical protein
MNIDQKIGWIFLLFFLGSAFMVGIEIGHYLAFLIALATCLGLWTYLAVMFSDYALQNKMGPIRVWKYFLTGK